VLATDADLHVRTRAPAPLDPYPNQLADPFLVQHGERVCRKELLVEIKGQELPDIVSAIAVTSSA
jgi:hypothetical protein